MTLNMENVPALTANNVNYSIDEDGAFEFSTMQLLADSGANTTSGAELSIVNVTNLDETIGVLTENGDGLWTYRPKAQFNGDVQFSFEIFDGASSLKKNIYLVVVPINHAPIVDTLVINTFQDTALTFTESQLIGSSYDPDGDLIYVKNVSATNGNISNDGNGVWHFKPLDNFHGVANLNYEVTDGQASTPCVAVIIIAPVTHAPVASFVKLEAQKNKAIKFTKSQLLGSSYDEDSDPLDVINVYATKGTITDHGDDTWTYMPMANFSGMITLNFSITDGFYTAPSQALVNVTTINHAPVTSRVTLFATQDSSIIISNAQLIGSSYDLDGDEMLAINVSSSDGKVIDNEDLTWTYIPNAGFVGKATLNFRVSDGRLSSPSSAIVNVRALNAVLGSMTSAYKQYIGSDNTTQNASDDKLVVPCKPTP